MLRAIRWIPWLLREDPGEETPQALDLRSIHAQHADFVWASLQRLGVRGPDLADAHQDVFITVHEKLLTYDGRASLRSWLFGICRKKAAAYRRKAWFRREEPTDTFDECSDDSLLGNPESHAEKQRAHATLEAILDRMDEDKRVVFVMFELEGISCDVIAESIGVPVGTVYSRLHTARKFVEKAVARLASQHDKAGAS